MENKTLVLCSGGLDSAVVAAQLKAQGHMVTLFYVAYGCRAEGKEIETVRGLADTMGLEMVMWRVSGLEGLHSALVSTTAPAASADLKGNNAWVPARNLLLVSFALAYGSTRGFDEVAIGNVADGIYPDNKPEFVNQFNKLVPHAIGSKWNGAPMMLVNDPIGRLYKRQVVQLGARLQVPFEKTWSCYESGYLHCGVCGSCVSRRNAFADIAIKDPTLYGADTTSCPA